MAGISRPRGEHFLVFFEGHVVPPAVLISGAIGFAHAPARRAISEPQHRADQGRRQRSDSQSVSQASIRAVLSVNGLPLPSDWSRIDLL